MTSLLPRSATDSTRADGGGADVGHRRPLVLIATLGGAAAAVSTLVVCLAVGVVGWFLTDAGAHGTPRGGLRAGALTWLVAHGSGVHVTGVAITAVPLGLTVLAAWTISRIGHRVGDSVSGHGPDADRIADGERDWTVLVATALFAAGYAVVAVVTTSLAATASTAPSGARVVLWSLMLCGLFAGPAIAVGSGRAAIWAAFVPPSARASMRACRKILTPYIGVAAVVFVVALAVDLGSAASVMSRLHTDGGDAALLTVLSTTVVPNAVVFAGSFLLGPGFAVGAHTLVSPSVVVGASQPE